MHIKAATKQLSGRQLDHILRGMMERGEIVKSGAGKDMERDGVKRLLAV